MSFFPMDGACCRCFCVWSLVLFLQTRFFCIPGFPLLEVPSNCLQLLFIVNSISRKFAVPCTDVYSVPFDAKLVLLHFSPGQPDEGKEVDL